VDFGRRRHGSNLRRTVLHRAALYGIAATFGVVVIWYFAGWITHLAYQGKYDAGAWLMPLFLLAYALNGIEGMLTSAMKASGIFRDAYLPQMLGSVGVGIVAVALIPYAGPTAAALAVLTGSAIGLGIATILFIRGCRPHA
jgi:O-antigen/teichoic acid export membrane protein